MTKHTRSHFMLVGMFLITTCLSLNLGFSQKTAATDTIGPIISDPLSVDSLVVFPSVAYEGDTIKLIVGTTHSSSPCGLLDYSVTQSSGNIIYVNARYWEGMLTAICHSTDRLVIGSLPAGKYVLNFMNRKKLEFIVNSRTTECIAAFTYSYPKCGDVKCINTVAFKDNSTGNIQSWFWDFGDSTYSKEQHPQHSYKYDSTYNVCLTVNGHSTNSCTDKVCKLVPLSLCQAKFSYEIIQAPTATPVDSLFAPMPMYLVKFTDLSANNIVLWNWDFGDNSMSDEQSPSHLYRSGKYIITLTIYTNTGCKSTFTDTLVLTNTLPQCQYLGTVRDYSGLDGCKYIIELDNGVKLNPVVIGANFLLRDSLRVILDYRPLKVATICMTGIPAEITCIREIVKPTCKAAYTWYWDRFTKIGCYLFNFFDKSDGNVNSWHWDFGDGYTSNEKNPSHCYPLDSDSVFYTVCLTITTKDGCSSKYCETVYANTKPPWVPIIGGEENHNIVIPAGVYCPELQTGDYIGIFFKDYYGNMVCGGMARWENKTLVLTAWQNTCMLIRPMYIIDPLVCNKDGFRANEQFIFKIWKHWANVEINILKADYQTSYLFPDSGLFKADGLSLIRELKSGIRQNIQVHEGWNLLSMNVEPFNTSMNSIFGNRNVIVKNYRGEIVYFPMMGIKESVWDKYEGYKVKAFDSFMLTVEGKPLPLTTRILLPGNKLPYFLPYYYQVANSIDKLMFEYKNSIRYVQSIEYINGIKTALNYIPKYGIDQIKNMKPGLGYKFSYYNGLSSFVYPLVMEHIPTDSVISPSSGAIGLTNAEDNRILVITDGTLNIQPGAKIVAKTVDGVTVGEELISTGSVGLTMWDLDSGTEYDQFVLEVTNNEGKAIYHLSFSQNTVQDGEIFVLEKTTPVVDVKDQKFGVRVYPALITNSLTVEINVGHISTAEVSIFNLLGHRVYTKQLNNLNEGLNKVTLELDNLNPGQYIYRVTTNKQLYTGKIQVVK